MNLDNRLINVLRDTDLRIQPQQAFLVDEICSLIDFTKLDSTATPTDISTLARCADEHHMAAVCVLPEHLEYVDTKNPIKRATVINFPAGKDSLSTSLKAVDMVATNQKLSEIDYVFPYSVYLSGNHTSALADCYRVYQHCKQQELTFKVILETGALPSNDMIYHLSTEILLQGCDFIKTSTGKIATGATISAVFSILSAIVDSNITAGIKVSGGIKTYEQATSYVRLAEHMLNKKANSQWFRFGASRLLGTTKRREAYPENL